MVREWGLIMCKKAGDDLFLHCQVVNISFNTAHNNCFYVGHYLLISAPCFPLQRVRSSPSLASCTPTSACRMSPRQPFPGSTACLTLTRWGKEEDGRTVVLCSSVQWRYISSLWPTDSLSPQTDGGQVKQEQSAAKVVTGFTDRCIYTLCLCVCIHVIQGLHSIFTH